MYYSSSIVWKWLIGLQSSTDNPLLQTCWSWCRYLKSFYARESRLWWIIFLDPYRSQQRGVILLFESRVRDRWLRSPGWSAAAWQVQSNSEQNRRINAVLRRKTIHLPHISYEISITSDLVRDNELEPLWSCDLDICNDHPVSTGNIACAYSMQLSEFSVGNKMLHITSVLWK